MQVPVFEGGEHRADVLVGAFFRELRGVALPLVLVGDVRAVRPTAPRLTLSTASRQRDGDEQPASSRFNSHPLSPLGPLE